MFKSKYLRGVFCLLLSIGLASCAQQPKVATSSEAIEQTKTMQSTEEKVKYLISEANAFINSEKFDEAILTAKYIISNLDKNSTEAQGIIEKAQAEVKKLAEQKLEEAKGELKGKIDSLGK